jgi:hypothetical protein
MTIPRTPPPPSQSPSPKTTNSFGSGPTIPSVENRVSASTEIWARDLRSLFEHAKERFGDVSWESEEGGERIWAHKGGSNSKTWIVETNVVAVIYARAPSKYHAALSLLFWCSLSCEAGKRSEDNPTHNQEHSKTVISSRDHSLVRQLPSDQPHPSPPLHNILRLRPTSFRLCSMVASRGQTATVTVTVTWEVSELEAACPSAAMPVRGQYELEAALAVRKGF